MYQKQPLHRILMNCQPFDKQLVDHKDRNKYNNCKPNLRIVTAKQNSRNISKKKGSSSQYFGVSKQREKWLVRYSHQSYGLFDSEQDAARIYDSIALYFDKNDPRVNFKESVPAQSLPNIKRVPQHNDDMKYISQKQGQTYRLNIRNGNCRYQESSKDLQHLQRVRDDKFIQKNTKQIFIEKDNHFEVQIGKRIMLISKEDVNDLKQYKFTVRNGYPLIYQKNDLITVHQYVMKKLYSIFPEGCVIDHINCNRLDARRNNLRFANNSQNNHNIPKKVNASSQYFGVCKVNNLFYSSIKAYGKCYQLGTYKNELHAAIAFNIKAVQLYQSHANLNVNINTSGYSLINDRLYFNNIKVENKTAKNEYFGVRQKNNKFMASFVHNKKNFYVGCHQTHLLAAIARQIKINQLNLQNVVLSNKVDINGYVLTNDNQLIRSNH